VNVRATENAIFVRYFTSTSGRGGRSVHRLSENWL